jgi:hypothetical protein
MAPTTQAPLSHNYSSNLYKHLSPSLTKNGFDTPNSEISSTNSPLASTNSSRDSSLVRPAKPVQLDFSVLQRLFSGESASGLEDSALWYILTTAVLLSYHKEKLIGDLWTHLTSQVQDDEELLAVARRIREACLKSSTLVGFPRVSQTDHDLSIIHGENLPADHLRPRQSTLSFRSNRPLMPRHRIFPQYWRRTVHSALHSRPQRSTTGVSASSKTSTDNIPPGSFQPWMQHQVAI